MIKRVVTKTFEFTPSTETMRRAAMLMALIFVVLPFSSMAATVDGSLMEWDNDTNMGTDSNGISMHVDWDSTNLYLAWDGTDLSSETEGADIFFYLNTSEDGSVTAKSWNGIKTLPFAADYGVVVEDSSYARVVGFSAGSWNDISTPEMHAGWSDNKVTEISIPLSDLGNP